jgi:hypothetical protein
MQACSRAVTSSKFLKYEIGVALIGSGAMASFFVEPVVVQADTAKAAIPLSDGKFLTTRLRQRPSRLFEPSIHAAVEFDVEA